MVLIYWTNYSIGCKKDNNIILFEISLHSLSLISNSLSFVSFSLSWWRWALFSGLTLSLSMALRFGFGAGACIGGGRRGVVAWVYIGLHKCVAAISVGLNRWLSRWAWVVAWVDRCYRWVWSMLAWVDRWLWVVVVSSVVSWVWLMLLSLLLLPSPPLLLPPSLNSAPRLKPDPRVHLILHFFSTKGFFFLSFIIIFLLFWVQT